MINKLPRLSHHSENFHFPDLGAQFPGQYPCYSLASFLSFSPSHCQLSSHSLGRLDDFDQFSARLVDDDDDAKRHWKQRGDRQCSSFNFFSQSEYEFFPCDCQLNLILVPNSRVWVLCLRSLRNFGIVSVRRCSREKRNRKCSFWSGLGFFNQVVLLRLDWPILFSFLGDGVTTP